MRKIHIIAPASSAKKEYKDSFSIGEKYLAELGYSVSYGDYIYNMDLMNKSASIIDRAADWENAWSNSNIDYILSFTGGTNSNQILNSINWSTVRDSNSRLIGYSDITVLANAVYAKTKKVSFLGVNFSYLCRKSVLDYTIDNFNKALVNNTYTVFPAEKVNMNMWSSPANIVDSEGWWVINGGLMEGKVLGGNLPSFRLLYGTEYMPDITDSVLFIEWDNFTTSDLEEFDREIEALTMRDKFDSVRGLVIGRFQEGSKVSKEDLLSMIQNKEKLKDLPILANVDFGHTAPMFLFPIGGNAVVDTNKEEIVFSY